MSSTSNATVTEVDALRASISFREQRLQALVLERERLMSSKQSKAVSKRRPGVLVKVEDAESEAECESMFTPKSKPILQAKRPLLTSGPSQNGVENGGEHGAGKAATSIPLGDGVIGSAASASSTALSTTTASCATSQPIPPSGKPNVSIEEPAPQSGSGAVVVLMSTTQATVFIIAALLMAALFGAFLLWFTLAYEPYDLIVKLVTSIPEAKQGVIIQYSKLRRATYRGLQERLEAFIARLEQLKDKTALAQRSEEM